MALQQQVCHSSGWHGTPEHVALVLMSGSIPGNVAKVPVNTTQHIGEEGREAREYEEEVGNTGRGGGVLMSRPHVPVVIKAYAPYSDAINRLCDDRDMVLWVEPCQC